MFGKKEKLTTLFFATDIHGSEKCWRKLVNSGAFYGAETIILGGDITGKGTQIILEEKPGLWTTDFLGDVVRLESQEELAQLESRVRNSGFYPRRMKPDEFQHYVASPDYREQVFEQVVSQTVAGWMDYAETKLKGSGRRIIVTAGNDDPHFVDDLFQHTDCVTWSEGQLVWLDDLHVMVNEGSSNFTPWNTHREMSEEELEKILVCQIELVKDMPNAVFNIHVPPFGSRLDDAPELDSSLRPKEGGQKLIPVGSKAVRNVIERYQPLLGLHGHIHESKGSVHIGRTLCINPGSTYGEGVLCGVLVSLDKKGIRSYQPVQG